MLTMTSVAAEHVSSFLKARGKGVGIRVKVITSGCSGYAYAIEFVDDLGDDDITFESNDVTIVTDPKSLPLIDGTELDYKTMGLQAGFMFNNPRVANECGCGESFTI